jgi:hypothetical protein
VRKKWQKIVDSLETYFADKDVSSTQLKNSYIYEIIDPDEDECYFILSNYIKLLFEKTYLPM